MQEMSNHYSSPASGISITSSSNDDSNNSPSERGQEQTTTLQPSRLEFVDWTPGGEELNGKKRPAAPRLHHKKSRFGCQQCRLRHVKCDEVHPSCGSCLRHDEKCVWRRDPKPLSSATTKLSLLNLRPKAGPKTSNAPSISAPDIDEPVESTSRRLLELNLLHQYLTSTHLSLNVSNDESINWSLAVPKIALAHSKPTLLYSVYSLTALHLANLEPSNVENTTIYEKYLNLTLKLHMSDVRSLSKDNADVVCLTATHLRVCTFALLQTRQVEPYSPPLDWLDTTSLAGRGLMVSAWQYLKDDETSIHRKMLMRAPGINPQSKYLRDEDLLFTASNRLKYLFLLHRTAEDEAEEAWDEGVRVAYETTLSLIGAIGIAIESGEARSSVFRRIVLFPTVMENEFIDLVRELRPRALAVLAHYFAYMNQFEELWWIGKTGKREVRAIWNILPERWRELIDEPMRIVDRET